MVGRAVAGKTAFVLLGAHRPHSLAGFLSGGVGAGGICRRSIQETSRFPGKRAKLGKNLKPVFLSFKKGLG